MTIKEQMIYSQLNEIQKEVEQLKINFNSCLPDLSARKQCIREKIIQLKKIVKSLDN